MFLNEFVPVNASLLIETAGPAIEISWGMFAISLGRLQKEILDYHQRLVLEPDRAAVGVPTFLAQLYRRPMIFRSKRLGRMETVGTIVVVPLVLVAVGLHLIQAGVPNAWLISVVAVGVAVVIGVLLLRHWIAESRYIELSSAGISAGPDNRHARLISWPELAFARVHAVAGRAPSSLTKLELRLRNGESVFIRALPAAERLGTLVDPPPDWVREVKRLLGEGRDLREAARAAGIPLE